MRQLPGWVWLALAIAFAGLASYMALGWLKRQAAVPAIKEKTSLVVVATTPVGYATSLSASQLKAEVWHQEKPPVGSFRSVQEVVGRVTATSFTPGELITENRLTPKGTYPGITAMLTPDKRAMTVKVDEASGLAGFLVPGDRVDVVVIMDKGEYDKDPFSKILLQDLKVLGTGQKMESRPGDKPQVVPTVTLEVSPEEGEGLALAIQEGRISLVLRGQGNQGLVETAGMNTTRLLGKPSKEKHDASPTRRTVEVIRSTKREAAEF